VQGIEWVAVSLSKFKEGGIIESVLEGLQTLELGINAESKGSEGDHQSEVMHGGRRGGGESKLIVDSFANNTNTSVSAERRDK